MVRARNAADPAGLRSSASGRLHIGQLRLEPGIAGRRRHVAAVAGHADIRSGRALVNLGRTSAAVIGWRCCSMRSRTGIVLISMSPLPLRSAVWPTACSA
jgi:hypothetical protein